MSARPKTWSTPFLEPTTSTPTQILFVVESSDRSIADIPLAHRRPRKSGKDGIGYPEFIIRRTATPDIVVVIECRAGTSSWHQSKPRQADRGYRSTALALCPLFEYPLPVMVLAGQTAMNSGLQS